MKNAIAIYFDGTLCENKYPEIGRPRTAVIEAAKKKQSEGCGLILWTCREGELLEEAISWCHENGLEFDAINESLPEWKEMFGNDPRKPGATEYWDDRSVNPASIEKVTEFMERHSLLGARCVCKGYLKKVDDGAFIQRIPPEQAEDKEEHFILHSNAIDSKAAEKSNPFDYSASKPEYEESSCCGEHELLKTYFERKEQNFAGVIVGKKKVTVTGWLTVDTYYRYNGSEYRRIEKEANEVIDCAVVYFSEGRKRYVPLEYITIL